MVNPGSQSDFNTTPRFTPHFGDGESESTPMSDNLKGKKLHLHEPDSDLICATPDLLDYDQVKRSKTQDKSSRWHRWFHRQSTASEEAKPPAAFPDDPTADELSLSESRPVSRGTSRRKSIANMLKSRKGLRSFSGAIAYNVSSSIDQTGSFDAINGPLSSLWEVERLKNSGARKDSTSAMFTDAWIIRELELQDAILVTTPFPEHLKQDFDDDFNGDASESRAIWKLQQSPCGNWLLVGTQRGWIYLYKIVTGHPKGIFNDLPIAIYKAHEGSVVDLAWLPPTPCGIPIFASIGFDRRLCIWLASRVSPLESVKTSEWSSSITLHPNDSSQLFLGSLDATVQLWRLNIDAEDPLHPTARAAMIDYVRVPDVVTAVSLSPDGQLLAVGVRRGSVALYDSHSLRFITEVECQVKKSKRWRSQSHRVVGLAWSDDSERFVATTHDSSLRMVNLRPRSQNTEQAVTKFQGHSLQHLLMSASFVQPINGMERIVIGSEDNYIYCYTPPKNDQDQPQYDKIKVTKQLMTACIVTTKAFDQFLNAEIHEALTYRLGNSECGDVVDLRQFGCERRSNEKRWQHPKYLGAIVGTYSGTIKVFVNFGLERSA